MEHELAWTRSHEWCSTALSCPCIGRLGGGDKSCIIMGTTQLSLHGKKEGLSLVGFSFCAAVLLSWLFQLKKKTESRRFLRRVAAWGSWNRRILKISKLHLQTNGGWEFWPIKLCTWRQAEQLDPHGLTINWQEHKAANGGGMKTTYTSKESFSAVPCPSKEAKHSCPNPCNWVAQL